jgi:hypothetical protein
VVHTNLIWPYVPLRKDGGGLSKDDDRKLRELVKDCHDRGMRLSLGLPPFPSVALVQTPGLAGPSGRLGRGHEEAGQRD